MVKNADGSINYFSHNVTRKELKNYNQAWNEVREEMGAKVFENKWELSRLSKVFCNVLVTVLVVLFIIVNFNSANVFKQAFLVIRGLGYNRISEHFFGCPLVILDRLHIIGANI